MSKIEVDISEVCPGKPSPTSWVPEGDGPAGHRGHSGNERSAQAMKSTWISTNAHALMVPTTSVLMPA